ncbi:uncharacterized protein A4U43_C05F500 [Asparagus officinalis]|uniref:Cysteine proteinase inhibitor n=1 Tax=Asparagus officinalis TaxID=4686 RepID=A0A5P1ESE0_ASPOF|nr:uncharacterized protein A4U43_C05F500 [Asparagus officinalis]
MTQIAHPLKLYLHSEFPVIMDSEESCDGEAVCGMPGGIQDRRMGENDAEMEELGRFAVDEHNKQQNTLLEFAGVVNAKEQVVAGTMYYLTVEAIEGGKKKLYEAKVWVKPWLNFKELQEFTPLADSSSGATAADLGAKQDD